jgi:hypothetical protein
MAGGHRFDRQPSPSRLCVAGRRVCRSSASHWHHGSWQQPILSEAIDPLLHKEDLRTQINSRVVENTLQQFLIFLVGTLALATNLSPEQMRVIPASIVVFIVARLAFWIGYRIHLLYRAFGMAATECLNVSILAAALWKTLG